MYVLLNTLQEKIKSLNTNNSKIAKVDLTKFDLSKYLVSQRKELKSTSCLFQIF